MGSISRSRGSSCCLWLESSSAPDVVGVVQPESLGGALPGLVGFAVAVILFEGGMNLNIDRLRKEGRAIRQLISIGALVTVIGAALAAKVFLSWSWE